MKSIVQQTRVSTSHGQIAVETAGTKGPVVLLIHGNSSCRAVFRKQMQSAITGRARLIAFDLPGHGESSDAPDPERTYTRSGLAAAAVEVLGALSVDEATVYGWSLGGHVAIEMIHRFPGMRALMISGTPPVGRDNMAEGFVRSPGAALAGKEVMTEDERATFIAAIFGSSAEPFLLRAVARTDGRFRKRLFEAARTGDGVNQRKAVESCTVPLAIVNGADDGIVNLDYIERVNYASLWDDRCHRLPGAGHACFWQTPEAFNPLFERFVAETWREL